MLTQNTERRGSMVSRVTSDVDTISQFVQFGGIILILSLGQIAVATGLMFVYSPLLTAVVWLCFVPLLFVIRRFQNVVGRAYTQVRERVGDLLAAVSESVVGAATIRAYGVEEPHRRAHRRTRSRQHRTAPIARAGALGRRLLVGPARGRADAGRGAGGRHRPGGAAAT